MAWSTPFFFVNIGDGIILEKILKVEFIEKRKTLFGEGRKFEVGFLNKLQRDFGISIPKNPKIPGFLSHPIASSGSKLEISRDFSLFFYKRFWRFFAICTH